MVSESIVLAILKASITGAGLVLASYSLILTIFPPLFVLRETERRELILEARRLTEEVSSEPTDEELGEIKATFRDIPARTVPVHMGWGIGLTFFGFILSSLMAISWILKYQFDYIDKNLIYIFGLTILIFGYIGIRVIKDIYRILKSNIETRPSEQKLGEEPSVII